MANNTMRVRGTARYPHLNEADTKFDDAGVFKTDIILDQETGSAIEQRFEKMRAAKLAETQKQLKGKKAKEADLPIQPEYDDDGNETGNYVLRVKMKASGISKKSGKAWSRQLPLFDAYGNSTKVRVGGGSEIIAAFEPAAWANPKGECSVTCRLEAVQVINPVEGGGGSASRFGFGEVDGGFKASEFAVNEDSTDASSEAGDEADISEDYDF